MPMRAYRCEAGHEFEVFESMSGPRTEGCICTADGDDSSSQCNLPVEPLIQKTQRPIVKGGTRLHHGMRGVE